MDERDRQSFFHYLVPVSQTVEQAPDQKTRKILQFERMMQREMQQCTENFNLQFESMRDMITRIDDHLQQMKKTH